MKDNSDDGYDSESPPPLEPVNSDDKDYGSPILDDAEESFDDGDEEEKALQREARRDMKANEYIEATTRARQQEDA